jgi:hypothetical protein
VSCAGGASPRMLSFPDTSRSYASILSNSPFGFSQNGAGITGLASIRERGLRSTALGHEGIGGVSTALSSSVGRERDVFRACVTLSVRRYSGYISLRFEMKRGRIEGICMNLRTTTLKSSRLLVLETIAMPSPRERRIVNRSAWVTCIELSPLRVVG